MNVANDGQDRKDNIEDNLGACSLAVPFELCGNSVTGPLFMEAHRVSILYVWGFPVFVVLR